MRDRDLDRQLHAVQSLFQRTRAASGDDIELMSHWARYLCVLCAGYLENALAAVYSDFCRRKSSDPVANFAVSTLEKIANPKTHRFLEVAGRFKPAWRDELTSFVDEDGRRDAIDSIMSNRHLIAHGGRSDITIARMSDYFAKSIRVVEFIERQCS